MALHGGFGYNEPESPDLDARRSGYVVTGAANRREDRPSAGIPYAWCLAVFCSLFTAFASASPTPSPAHESDRGETRRVRLRFTGDVMMHEPQIGAGHFSAVNEYRYESFFEAVRPYLSDADWTIGNLETTLVERNYTGYPCFASPERLARALKWAGFDVMVTANNHCLDRREYGVRNTLDVLDAFGLAHAGTARTPDEHGQIRMLDKNGIRIAVLAYTEMANGIDLSMEPDKVAYLVHFMRAERIIADMLRARALDADAVLVFLHWGDEYQRQPAKRQMALAEQLAEAGADLIVGCHPHVLQPAVWKAVPGAADGAKRVIVAYSLGNFISNQVVRFKDAGAILEVVLEKSTNEQRVRVVDASLIPTWIHLYEIAGRRGYRVVPVQETLAAQAAGWEPMLCASHVRRLSEALNDTRSLLATAGQDAAPIRNPDPLPWPARPLHTGPFHFACSDPLIEFAWDTAAARTATRPRAASIPRDALVLAAFGSRDPARSGPEGLSGVRQTLATRLMGLVTRPQNRSLHFAPGSPAFLDEAELIWPQPSGSVTVRYARDHGFQLLVSEGLAVSTDGARRRNAVSVETLPKGALRPLSAFEEECLARWLWRAATAARTAIWVALDEQVVRVVADGLVQFERPCAAPPKADEPIAGWYNVSDLAGKDAPANCEIRDGRATAAIWPDVKTPEDAVLLSRAIYARGIDARTVGESRGVTLCGAPVQGAAQLPAPGRGIRMRSEDAVVLFDLVTKGTPVLVTRFPAPANPH